MERALSRYKNKYIRNKTKTTIIIKVVFMIHELYIPHIVFWSFWPREDWKCYLMLMLSHLTTDFAHTVYDKLHRKIRFLFLQGFFPLTLFHLKNDRPTKTCL